MNRPNKFNFDPLGNPDMPMDFSLNKPDRSVGSDNEQPMSDPNEYPKHYKRDKFGNIVDPTLKVFPLEKNTMMSEEDELPPEFEDGPIDETIGTETSDIDKALAEQKRRELTVDLSLKEKEALEGKRYKQGSDKTCVLAAVLNGLENFGSLTPEEIKGVEKSWAIWGTKLGAYSKKSGMSIEGTQKFIKKTPYEAMLAKDSTQLLEELKDGKSAVLFGTREDGSKHAYTLREYKGKLAIIDPDSGTTSWKETEFHNLNQASVDAIFEVYKGKKGKSNILIIGDIGSEFKSKSDKESKDEKPVVRPEDLLTEKEEEINDYIAGLTDEHGVPLKRDKEGKILESEKTKAINLNQEYKKICKKYAPDALRQLESELREFYETKYGSQKGLQKAFNIDFKRVIVSNYLLLKREKYKALKGDIEKLEGTPIYDVQDVTVDGVTKEVKIPMEIKIDKKGERAPRSISRDKTIGEIEQDWIDLDTTEKQIKSIAEGRDDISKEIENIKNNRENVRNEFIPINDEFIELYNKREDISNELEKIQGEFKEQEIETDLKDIEHEHNELKDNHNTLTAEQESIKHKIVNLAKKIAKGTTNKVKKEWILDREYQLENLKDELAKKLKEKNTQKQKLDTKTQELGNKRKELKAKKQELKDKKDELNVQQKDLDSKKLELDDKKREINTKNLEITAKEEDKKNEIEKLKTKKQELESNLEKNRLKLKLAKQITTSPHMKFLRRSKGVRDTVYLEQVEAIAENEEKGQDKLKEISERPKPELNKFQQLRKNLADAENRWIHENISPIHDEEVKAAKKSFSPIKMSDTDKKRLENTRQELHKLYEQESQYLKNVEEKGLMDSVEDLKDSLGEVLYYLPGRYSDKRWKEIANKLLEQDNSGSVGNIEKTLRKGWGIWTDVMDEKTANKVRTAVINWMRRYKKTPQWSPKDIEEEKHLDKYRDEHENDKTGDAGRRAA